MVCRIALIPLALLAGCNDTPTVGQQALDRADAKSLSDNPPGRYQMIQGVNPASVAILDTRLGTVQNCFIVNYRYHCLAQGPSARFPGGLPPGEWVDAAGEAGGKPK